MFASMPLWFGRARGIERHQLKWVAYGASVLVAITAFRECVDGMRIWSPPAAPEMALFLLFIVSLFRTDRVNRSTPC
jgi:hypothetical protein